MTRVLLAITVYNGRAVVPRTLVSAARVAQRATSSVDVLVLDDCSPEPGWSAECAELCADLGIGYYRSPRNLGIPRNVNLAMAQAVDAGYDYVIVANSDVVFPWSLADRLVAVAQSDASIGSVTTWSNNVSIYSIPNNDPDQFLADQDVVDRVCDAMHNHFGVAALDVPAGISFAILFPTGVLRRVGVTDPIYGRGYCEETDWSLRSQALGFRICLAPGVFAYHAGRGSNLQAGLVSGHQTSVPENEDIIDLRYPLFRGQVDAFRGSDVLDDAIVHAVDQVIRSAARDDGWTSFVGRVDEAVIDDLDTRVHVGLHPDNRGLVEATWRGFRQQLILSSADPVADLTARFGQGPTDHTGYPWSESSTAGLATYPQGIGPLT